MQIGDGDLELGRELVVGRRAAVPRLPLLAGALDGAARAAQRARRPVLAAQLVHDRAGYARPGVLLEGRALDRVEPVDRGDQRQQATRDQVVQLAVGRQLAHLAAGEVLDHRCVGQDEAVARGDIATLNPPAPQRLGALGGWATGGRESSFHWGTSGVLGTGVLGHLTAWSLVVNGLHPASKHEGHSRTAARIGLATRVFVTRSGETSGGKPTCPRSETVSIPQPDGAQADNEGALRRCRPPLIKARSMLAALVAGLAVALTCAPAAWAGDSFQPDSHAAPRRRHRRRLEQRGQRGRLRHRHRHDRPRHRRPGHRAGRDLRPALAAQELEPRPQGRPQRPGRGDRDHAARPEPVDPPGARRRRADPGRRRRVRRHPAARLRRRRADRRRDRRPPPSRCSSCRRRRRSSRPRRPAASSPRSSRGRCAREHADAARHPDRPDDRARAARAPPRRCRSCCC